MDSSPRVNRMDLLAATGLLFLSLASVAIVGPLAVWNNRTKRGDYDGYLIPLLAMAEAPGVVLLLVALAFNVAAFKSYEDQPRRRLFLVYAWLLVMALGSVAGYLAGLWFLRR